ncbi:MAG: ATP:cob(I)alamin adenosyltransferase [Candidatus Woesearchaeota archaeon]
MVKVYTKTGDKGTTLRYNGQRVPKDDESVIIVSLVDSLLGSLDLAIVSLTDTSKIRILESIQTKLWQTAGELSRGSPTAKIKDEVKQKDIDELELLIDKYSIDLKHFVSFRTESAARLNEARLRTRKLEVSLTKWLREKKVREEIYTYFNRLSDFLYVLACDESKNNLRIIE